MGIVRVVAVAWSRVCL